MNNDNEMSLGKFFASPRKLSVPDYQRPYAWSNDERGEGQLAAFWDDLDTHVALGEGTNYFLGQLLVEDSGSEYLIVDGQQRLTTTVIFVRELARRLQQLEPANLQIDVLDRDFLKKDGAGNWNFSTGNEDTAFFRHHILDGVDTRADCKTPSQRRLIEARDFFRKKLKECNSEHLWRLYNALSGAKVILYTVSKTGAAMHVFELQNDRGKPLTQLEALKAFLMYSVHRATEGKGDQALEDIKANFGNIYRTCRELEEKNEDVDEDSILRYHYVAFEEWTQDEYWRPSATVRLKVRKLPSTDVVNYATKFARRLNESFDYLNQLIKRRDEEKSVALCELFAHGRMYIFFPLLLKLQAKVHDDRQFEALVRLLEIFAFRAYGMADLRADAGQSHFYRTARNFNGDVTELAANIKGMCNWRDIQDRFERGLCSPAFYYQGKDARYFLWRYENWLRAGGGGRAAHPRITHQQYMSSDSRTRLTVEHIAAQNGDDARSSIDIIGFKHC